MVDGRFAAGQLFCNLSSELAALTIGESALHIDVGGQSTKLTLLRHLCLKCSFCFHFTTTVIDSKDFRDDHCISQPASQSGGHRRVNIITACHFFWLSILAK